MDLTQLYLIGSHLFPPSGNICLKFDPIVDAKEKRKDLPWWLIFRTTPYLSTILANMSGCAVFYSNVAMSR